MAQPSSPPASTGSPRPAVTGPKRAPPARAFVPPVPQLAHVMAERAAVQAAAETGDPMTAIRDGAARRVLARHMADTPLTFWGRVLEAQVGAIGGGTESAAAALYEATDGTFVLELVVPDGREGYTAVRHALQFIDATAIGVFLAQTRIHEAAIGAAVKAVTNAAVTVPRLQECSALLPPPVAIQRRPGLRP